MPLAGARPKLGAVGNAQLPLERIAREPQIKRDSFDTRHEANGEHAQKVQDFIDTVLTNGEFLPVTGDTLDPAFSSDGSSQNQGFSGNSANAEQPTTTAVTSNAPSMAVIRAAAEAWQQTEPQRVNTTGLPTGVATYLYVQSGSTPALGLSLFA